jgi:eukaryotic-like serine/threonine-protein kinase
MSSPTGGQTLFLPKANPRTPSSREVETGLPTDLISQSAYRLRTLALLYAFVFFMAGIFPALLFDESRAMLLVHTSMWLPAALSIAMALVVAFVACNKLISLSTSMTIGLIFEVLGSYGIAAAEFPDPMGFSLPNQPYLGLSWVAVWTMLFTVVVPTAPKRALIAALLSVSAVPVTVAIAGTRYLEPSPALQLFFGFTFPYLLVVLMAYVGSQVVYGLGKEVSRARELGSYVLVERIGQGGMGEVWRAKHRLLARPAAIKLIRPALTSGEGSVLSAEVRRRFELEAQTISSLRSPHTVNLYDFGVADDGAFYYVMELLDGLDADSLVRRTGALPPERVIAILRQICHSLSEAEANGLVHRDIKPANIFLCRYGEEFDFVKVLDFGIVKAVDNNSADTRLTQMTSENVVRGTPSFIAPEQALGSATIDGRADIYSLGCVAYWLLTGELVFTAETQMGVLIHHAHTLPTPPSQRTDRPIPPALEALVMSCLAKDPGQRPQSARELSERLAAIALPEEWTPQRAKEWWDVSGPIPHLVTAAHRGPAHRGQTPGL